MNRIQTDNSSTSAQTVLDAVLNEFRLPGRRKIPHQRNLRGDGGDTPKLRDYQVQYLKRKAAGLCTATGCPAKAEDRHTHCRKHLRLMSRRHRERYESRAREALCIYCGERPRFWGVRCIICRQKFAKNPLPSGARRALRLYRQAEQQRDLEHLQVEARLAAWKLLATRDVTGKCARALRLYVGIDGGKWRTYEEVGQLMGISKERVRQLLRPSKMLLEGILGDRNPWKSVFQRRSRRSESQALTLKRNKPRISTSSRPQRGPRTNEVRA
jgi:hypothetical protein